MSDVESDLKAASQFAYNMKAANEKSRFTDEMYARVYIPLTHESEWHKSVASTLEFYMALLIFGEINKPHVEYVNVVSTELSSRIDKFPQRHEAALRLMAAQMAKAGQCSCNSHLALDAN